MMFFYISYLIIAIPWPPWFLDRKLEGLDRFYCIGKWHNAIYITAETSYLDRKNYDSETFLFTSQ